MTSLDYAKLADLYDSYCIFAKDIPYFLSVSRDARGPILELMAGTGRLSIPLLRGGCSLICVDREQAMLAVLRRKLSHQELPAQIICGDVCDMPIGGQFDLVLLPFQGFSELERETGQRSALAEIGRLLAPGGRFVCTMHNPPVRLRTIDGSWHQVGSFPHEDGIGRISVWIRADFDQASRIVDGFQRVERLDSTGKRIDERSVRLRFSLLGYTRFQELATAAGFEAMAVHGDYDGAPFEEEQSPCMIWTLRKAP